MSIDFEIREAGIALITGIDCNTVNTTIARNPVVASNTHNASIIVRGSARGPPLAGRGAGGGGCESAPAYFVLAGALSVPGGGKAARRITSRSRRRR